MWSKRSMFVFARRHYCVSLISPTQPFGMKPPLIKEDVKVGVPAMLIDVNSFPPERIRNFCIVAHVDHGKTTLSDAILRRTGVIRDVGEVATYLDKLEVEKARGITVKAQTCSFFIKPDASKEEIYLCNIVDTPGHVDFSYEVTRSIAVCEGAVLLVDACQGIQAQTMANLHIATERKVHVIPALSKLDGLNMPHQVDEALTELEDAIGVFREEVVLTAAKKLSGIEALLKEIVKSVPAPTGKAEAPFRGLIFDAWPDPMSEQYRCLVRVKDGSIKPGNKLVFCNIQQVIDVKEVGIMFPEPTRTLSLNVGQVGYITFSYDPTRMKKIEIGDTLAASKDAELIASFAPMRPVVFAGLFPDQGADPEGLKTAIDKLVANDPSVSVTKTKCGALGSGYQIGVLGMLHLKIFQERLDAEYNQTVLLTPSSVSYRYIDKDGNDFPLSADSWVPASNIEKYLQPVVNATIVCHQEHFKEVHNLMTTYKGMQVDHKTLAKGRVSLIYRLPLIAMARGIFDKLKKVTSGYASLEYDDPTYEDCDLVKIDIYVNKVQVDALSVITERKDAYETGRRIAVSLKNELSRSSLDIPITAQLGGKIIARETVSGIKKNVTHKCHAGDPTRKMKLVENQKACRKKAASRQVAGVELGQEALLAAMQAVQ